MKLSVVIITLNEEKNIRRCLDSVKGLADEIVLVDSGSLDDTVKIAKKYNARVFFRDFDNYANQKNYALEKANGPWIFSVDADEEISGELAKEIRQVISKNDFDGYLIPRKNIILGGEIKHSRWSPDKHVWLWKKDKGSWRGKVHEEVLVKGPIGELKGAKIHYQSENVRLFFEMINRYTEIEAEEKKEKGIGFSFFRLFYDPCLSFFRRYFYKKGFSDGWRGFILCYLMAIYRMTVWFKVWERRKEC